ncbi:hypothetical protein [Chengkuizengella marina]|uniref:Uncharacterized protein n=1 Tax=Chengkuizengella marina TaxID=2507566 RepID=A0A6N9Q0Z8_9BACL|nr:hypothetical protein [Chengkuizengella marina]NBI27810.1 hypothetical protein [Chengkuizengella marina]
MDVFDEFKCNCCVCPMQCVLEQLVGVGDVNIITPTANNSVIINQVKDFIAFTSNGNIPICQITATQFSQNLVPDGIKLKPIKKSKGECACCENPITNLANSMIGEMVEIEFISPFPFPFVDKIIDVGKGIVVGRFFNDIDIFSSCAITRIIQQTQQQINDPPLFSNFQQLKKGTPPPAN